ncbi:MAG: histidine--tRNA ligase, partial [Muribaculaceae bacterium]|nr:histidine--tRNA ligase [Muribaculaceae bacterium]
LNQLNLYPESVSGSVKVLFVNFGEKEARAAAVIAKYLRAAGISCELYPDNAKMKKQMGYADALAIPFVALLGESEIEEGVINVKDMHTGEQVKLTTSELIDKLKSKI